MWDGWCHDTKGDIRRMHGNVMFDGIMQGADVELDLLQ